MEEDQLFWLSKDNMDTLKEKGITPSTATLNSLVGWILEEVSYSNNYLPGTYVFSLDKTTWIEEVKIGVACIGGTEIFIFTDHKIDKDLLDISLDIIKPVLPIFTQYSNYSDLTSSQSYYNYTTTSYDGS